MKSYILNCLLVILLLLTGCKQRFLDYPYAENNTTTSNYFGIEIPDDYQWLEMNPAKNSGIAQWLKAQGDLSDKFFKNKDLTVYKRIEELVSFPRFGFVGSTTDTLYYAGIYPYSAQIDLYKYTGETGVFMKRVTLPYQVETALNGLVLSDGNHIAFLGGQRGGRKDIFIYNLADSTTEPECVVANVLDFGLIPRGANSFYFVRDAFASESTTLGQNSVFECVYTISDNKIKTEEREVYTDMTLNSIAVFDIAYDEVDDELYIGEFGESDPEIFVVSLIRDKESVPLCSFKSIQGGQYRLAGADDVNLYVLGIDSTIKGTLYALNKKSRRLLKVVDNPTMDIRYFSLIKDHAIIYFQNEKSNRGYMIDKHTLALTELPLMPQSYYKFHHNKKSDQIFFQKESLIAPKEIYIADSKNHLQVKKVSDARETPFDPADYVIENVTHTSRSGAEVNLQLTYKKGMIRDGSNPVVIHSYINAENSLLDRFYLNRVLYMDQGYIYVQRAMSDSKIELSINKRIEDIYSSYLYLIKENYTSADKVAFIGKEFGASALVGMLNKYDLKTPVALVDGVYDFVKYNNQGRLLYQNKKLFQAHDSISFHEIYAMSPYHQVKTNKKYPPMLLLTTDKNKIIPEDQTYKLAARMQMRTKGYNPIIMLTPKRADRLDEYDEYTYRIFIEHGFLFISDQLGVNVNVSQNKGV